MLQPGDKIHHYLVEAEVGGGGMARVYRVRHTILGHQLALKVLDPYWVGQGSVRQRFLAEGQIQAMVKHPAIVMVTDAVIDAERGIAGLLMEYIEGPNLEQFVGRRPTPPPADLVRSLLVPVLQGMHHAHQEGVIHRDLKPANVLLSRDATGSWHPHIVDFGVAHVAEAARNLAEVRRKTQGGGLLGTPAFMCPEQVLGTTSPNAQWDVFSIGTILYELATLHHPFEDPDDEEATLDHVADCHFKPPREVYPDIDPNVERAILGALVKDPDDRFPDCATMAAALSAEFFLPAPSHPTTIELDVLHTKGAADDLTMPVPESPEALLLLGDHKNAPEWVIRGWSTTVGTDADLKLPRDGGVEPVHCEIRYRDGDWWLEDRSTSGSRVNGARIHLMQLDDGDLIRLGHTILRFSAMPLVLPEPATEEDPLPDAPAWLLTANGERVSISPEGVIIGRDPDVALWLDDPEVSRRHCRIHLQGLDVLVEDLGSVNGTLVNGQRVRYRSLRNGDELTVGSARMTLITRR